MFCSTGNSGVEYGFSKGELLYSIVLALKNKESEEFLYFVILVLDLIVAFRVIGSYEPSLDAEVLVKCSHVPNCKLRFTI